MGDFFAGLIGAGLNYLGTSQSNQENLAAVNATNAANEQIAAANNAQQMQLAQHGLSMKVADAASVGISPLAALGAADPSASFSQPVLQTPTFQSPLSAMSGDIRQMGQSIDRARAATLTPEDKMATSLDLRKKAAEADLIETQAANAHLELIKHAGSPGIRTGSVPVNASVMVRNSDGSVDLVPNPDIAYGMSHTPFGGLNWMLNNKLIPSLDEIYTNVFTHGQASPPDFGQGRILQEDSGL